jgi:hypothetical protein
MSIWNKILLGFILVASLAFFWLAARVLKTHQYWRATATKLDEELKAAEQERSLLRDGDDSAMGVREAVLALHELMIDRGRVWRNTKPLQVRADNQGVNLRVATDLPDPHGIPVKAVLYIFEEKGVEQGGSYLGEFTVTGVGEKDLQLVPSMKLSDRELQRLQQSQGPWTLYEVVPVDQREVLAGLEEGEIRAMFPDGTEGEYLADREAMLAAATDPDAAKPTRQLRDYEILFGEQHKLRSMLADRMAAASHDLEYLEAALADAKQQEQYRRDEIARLGKEKTEELKQQQVVTAHLQAVQDKLAETQASIDELIESNRQYAGEIARIQLEATRAIDAQTRRMAQASSR